MLVSLDTPYVDTSAADLSLAAPGSTRPALALPADAPPLRFLDPAVLRAVSAFPADRRRLDLPASTLLQPRVLEYARTEWRGY